MRYSFFEYALVLPAALGLADLASAAEPSTQPVAAISALKDSRVQAFVESYCLDCHDCGSQQAGFALDQLLTKAIGSDSAAWEKVVRKLTSREMPPAGSERPSEREYVTALARLESSLDAAAAISPNPGRTETFRRLNRTEYANVVRDLLGLQIDAASFLPDDERSHGFDNVTVVDLSPSLLNRYLSAAEKISRLAVGTAEETGGQTFRIRPDVTQDSHVEGLPIGTRGGALFSYYFPVDGEYEVQVRLMRDRNEEVEGLREPHELEVLIDRTRAALFTVKPPAKGSTNQAVDANLNCRIQVEAGPHKLGATFLKKPSSLLETTRQPLNVHFNYYRHPRIGPAVFEVSVVGPIESRGPGTTTSRERVFISRPAGADDEEACAKRILAILARRAYRRPVADEDLAPLLKFFKQGQAEGGFEAGIETALSALLVNPQFLFRIERDPPEAAANTAYQINDVELASRLSFFLWSSAPDEELLSLAERDELSRPEVLEKQVIRMLADARSRSLVTNFAAQWLYLQNLESVSPDMRLFPDFDDNLRQALRKETELLFEEVVREDRSVLDLLQADHTYLNERLARHYGIPHVYGSRFRRVALPDQSQRGGLLRQGSILTLTSYATRTSPVIRGHWVLQNLIGAPPPPPPPDIPALTENSVSSRLTTRERLKQHSTDATCATCHRLMDPIGFSLEQYDAVGRWRKTTAGEPIDADGAFIDGSEFSGAAGLEQALLKRPEIFVRTLTEKLLIFGLGRGVEPYDAPAVRQIVRDARADEYRFSRLISGVVRSTPFQKRKTP